MLTAKMKNWLVKNAGVSADATDEQFKAAAAEAMVDGSLSMDTVKSLTETDDDVAAGGIKALLQGLTDAVKSIGAQDEEDDEEFEEEDDEKGASKTETKATKAAAPDRLKSMLVSVGVTNMGLLSEDDSDGDKSFTIRVKEAADQYDTTKSTLKHAAEDGKGRPNPHAGRPVLDYTEGGGTKVLETASDRDKAVAGAWAQFHINSKIVRSKSLAFQQLPEHTKQLLCYAMENEKWGGASDGGNFADIKDRKLTPNEQKALIDDATSGGLEAAPIVFDDQVIQTPLLNGELYPLVNTVALDRGRRVEGVATGTVTAAWGGVDDSAISLFNTASYVSAFDTTIFRWEGAIRVGLDFLSDTPIDFGAHITSQYGERLLEDLDDVIATGNGTTQPEGFINKTGATSVSFGAATSLSNYESLRFGIAKPEHKASVKSSAVFCGTETSYQRARAIPVGASDARRLGGGNYDSYSWMERPYKINESLTNAQIAYVILARFRMYRRRGLVMRTSTEGDTLIRNNEMLMVAMARYGGQMERGAVVAVTTDAPA